MITIVKMFNNCFRLVFGITETINKQSNVCPYKVHFKFNVPN